MSLIWFCVKLEVIYFKPLTARSVHSLTEMLTQQKIICIDPANDWHCFTGHALFVAWTQTRDPAHLILHSVQWAETLVWAQASPLRLVKKGKVLSDSHETEVKNLNRMRWNWFAPGVKLVYSLVSNVISFVWLLRQFHM